ncbi:dentin sialophosphoprotein isoform X2 [Abrus precatorius]|uniref:Dentin sialophosphoprotein isoform X2 n=1 Tax=Abrus precatorius TaxID=3816 RepID=A0A8B8MAU8_ABRPR|nr:dentin sialophosphoprotein isoform X2 [Abrus precatorius]
MAEEEDDDESFGDFTFASFPNQPFRSTSNHTNPLDDDDWGDFVNHSNQINGAVSKPFDPFPPSLDPTDKHVNDNNGIVVQPKKKGAIPLSIFGVDEEEGEDEEPASANVFADKSNGAAVKSRSDTNGSVGISDLISTLYSQHPQMNSQNGSISISNVAAPNSKADGLTNSNASKLNSDSDSDSEDEDGWEFKSAEWETGVMSQNVKSEVPKHGNGSIGVGTMMDSSTGISDKSGGWHLEFEFSPSSALQDHISPQQLGPKSESNEIGNRFAMFPQNFEELNSGSGSNRSLEPLETAYIYPTNMEGHKFDGAAPHHTIDSSLASESRQSDEWGFGFSFNSGFLGEDNHSSESYLNTKNNQNDNNKNNSSPVNMNTDSDVNLFESKDAVTEIGTKPEKPLISSENHREALPLSIFGDEMPDTDELSVSQDLSPYAPTSSIRNGFNSPGSNLSINDLIWNLYSQAENNVSPNVTPKASDNQIHASPKVAGSSLVTSGDNFDDDLDFKDASPGTRFSHESAQKNPFNHAPLVNESSNTTVLNSDLTNPDGDFEDDSWEFKDAISGTSQDQASTLDHQDLSPIPLSTKLELIDYVEFYSKLKDELCNYVMFHLQNIKNAQSAAALSGEDAKAKALQEEIQELSKTLHQNNMSTPNEYLLEDYSPRNACFVELLELLKEPKFQPLESEYQLASRLSMVNKDIKSALELLENTASTLRILKLGSREEQSNYLTIWSKIAFVCSQELKHGAYIWKQAVQNGVNNQILSNPKGVQYIHAIGEIYRVAEIIGASAKLHKPWILSGSIDPKSLFAPLNECYSIWLASGLEEALFSISNQNNFEPDDISRELVESIKYIHELDEHALQSYVISGEQTTCQLSALPAGFIPGLNLVTWNGKHYFVKLANLWVNLISSDPPKK